MKRILALLACAALPSAFGGLTTAVLLASLNDPLPGVPALLERAADPEPPPSPPRRRAVVVLLDGVGEAKLRPAARAGALGTITAEIPVDTGTPSLSRPGYHALLTGVPPLISGIRNNPFTRGRADSVAHRVRAAGGTVAWLLDGVPWFHDLFGAPGEPVGLGQSWSVERFSEVWKNNTTLVVVHLAATDGAAHHEGTEGVAYREALAAQLRQVAAIRAVVEASPDRERSWIFVGSDHGHRPEGGHGGPEPVATQVSWLALGPVSAERSAQNPERVPLGAMAAVIAGTMGLPPPRQALFAAPSLPFLESEGSARIEARRVTLLPAVESIAREQRRRAWARLGAAALLLVAVTVAWARRSPGTAQRLASLLPVAAACGVFLALGPGLSLSSVQNERVYIEQTLLWSALGAALGWPVARRLGASARATLLGSALLPLAAWATSGGSLGRAGLGDQGTMLWGVLGMIPSGLSLGLLAAVALDRHTLPTRSGNAV